VTELWQADRQTERQWFVILFLITFVILYGVLCLYVLRWLKPAFAWKRTGILAFVLFTTIMLACAILYRVLDRADYLTLARLMGVFGHLWMLMIMWIVSFGLVAEVWNILVFIVSRRRPAVQKVRLSPHRPLLGTHLGIVHLGIAGEGSGW